jgi:putative membrane protein
MRRLVLVALAALFASTAHAQFGDLGTTAKSGGPAAGNAVQSGVNAVAKGTSAVTGTVTGEREAKTRIESSGYSDVTDLSKDSYGIWHAKAQKFGMPVTVSLDTRGIVKTD